jgi:hypothetical protein
MSGSSDDAKYLVDPMTITVVGGMVVTVITAIATAAVSIITSLRVSAVAKQQASDTSQLNTVRASTEAIEGHVNSEKTAANGREALLQTENRLLREMLTHETSTAALLAQAASVRPTPTVAEVPPVALIEET